MTARRLTQKGPHRAAPPLMALRSVQRHSDTEIPREEGERLIHSSPNHDEVRAYTPFSYKDEKNNNGKGGTEVTPQGLLRT